MSQQNGVQPQGAPEGPVSQVPLDKMVPYLQQQISNLSFERAAYAARCEVLLEDLARVTGERDQLKQLVDGLGGAAPVVAKEPSK